MLIVQEAGWAPGPVWTGTENLAPTGIRSPDRPARSLSLYQLSYPARLEGGRNVENNSRSAHGNETCRGEATDSLYREGKASQYEKFRKLRPLVLRMGMILN